MCFFFFFQAEDGIRDGHVTGVQTCALPIFGCATVELDEPISGGESDLGPDEARLRMLGVLPETRGRGIGEALTRAAIEAARERGRTRMVLNSAEYMTQAHRIYERLGFSREPDWVGEDGFRMRTYSMDLPG